MHSRSEAVPSRAPSRAAAPATGPVRALGVALVLAACSPSPPGSEAPRPRLVVLYSTCSLNRGYLSPYDPTVTTTPELARFAKDARVFERHVTETGISGVAFASIVSGTQAPRHGVYFHPRALPDELYLVPEAFADAGYDTFFWSGHPMASARWGYGQGIPEEHVVATDRPRHRAPRGAASMKPAYRGSMLFPSRNRLTGNDAELDALIARLVADPDYRAYVQVFFTITHNPYYRRFDAATFDAFASAHPELVGELTAEDIERNLDLLEANEHGLQYNHAATVARLGLSKGEVAELVRVQELFYRVCVAELDRFFGRFLDKLRENGLYDQSLIAFTSDHGEMLHRDNALFSWTHGEQLVPEVLQVPLIVRSPVAGVEPGRYADVTRSIDVFPTLASLCGIALPARAAIEGVDLSAAVRGEADPPELRAFAHTALVNDIHALADEDAGLRNALFPAMDPSSMWTLMRNRERAYKLRRTLAGDWQLQVFDWDADPTERRDLYDASNREHAAARAELEAYKALLVRSYRPDSELDGDTISDEETAERLRALGYVK